jgi:uncharacterized Ntn-hydrolase superfamily protein
LQIDGEHALEGAAMTYSIVARDPATGALGVAVQTCMFGVGTVVPWARPGVGAVATQAFAEPAYGPRCLEALESGLSAQDALATAAAADPTPFLRQIGVVSADGTVAATTGEACIDYAGHVIGEGFTVQANMMASPDVWPTMAEAFLASTASFERRLLMALHAGQAMGGDARGMMSAAILVVEGQPGDAWTGRRTDLRVDYSVNPLQDLERLLDAAEGFGYYQQAVWAFHSGQAETALAEIERGLDVLPADENMQFVRAGALLARGDIDGGRAQLRSLIAARPTWATIVRSFAAKGLLALPPSAAIDDLLV